MNTIKMERNSNGKVIAGIVTKAFMKQADIFGTDEYYAIQKFYEMHPSATIKTKTIKKNPDKKTNKNLTYEKMQLFINTVASNKEECERLLEEMNKVKNASKIQKRPYQYVLDWFKATFPDYTSHEIFKDKEENSNSENSNVVPMTKVQ